MYLLYSIRFIRVENSYIEGWSVSFFKDTTATWLKHTTSPFYMVIIGNDYFTPPDPGKVTDFPDGTCSILLGLLGGE